MPTILLQFKHDAKNVDGSAYTAAQFAGLVASLDGGAFVSVSGAEFDPDGSYDVAYDVTLAPGAHTAQVALKHVDGTTSAPSNTATFTVEAREATPPFGLSATYVP